MKRILFVTRSRLSENLMAIIIHAINKKVDFRSMSSLAELAQATFAKPVQLIILDNNVLKGPTTSEMEPLKILESRQLAKAHKIFLHARQDEMDREKLERFGFGFFLTKPFLTEELLEIINMS